MIAGVNSESTLRNVHFLAGAAGFAGSVSLLGHVFQGLNRPLFELLILTLAAAGLFYANGRRWARWLLANWHSSHPALLAGTLAAAVLLTLLAAVPTLPFPALRTLEISPTGQKNTASESSEIEITELVNAGQLLAPQEMQAGWQNHAGVIFSVGSQPAVLRYQIPTFGKADVTIKFRKTPRSGIVQIRWDGQTQTRDLYSLQQKSSELRLEDAPTWQQTSQRTRILVAFVLLCDMLTLWLLLFSAVWAARQLPGAVVNTGVVLFPLLLIGGTIYNLNITRQEAALYPRVPSTRLFDLLENRLGQQFQLTLEKYYAGRVLIAPSVAFLEEIEQPAERFLAMGQISRVEYQPYRTELTDEQKKALESLQQITLTSAKAPEVEMHILTTDPQPERPLCIKRWQQWIFIGPDNLLPDCGARP